MTGVPAILSVDLAAGANVDSVVAARALIAWSEAIKEAAKIVLTRAVIFPSTLSAPSQLACVFQRSLISLNKRFLGKYQMRLTPSIFLMFSN
jgi:hypothetical protein